MTLSFNGFAAQAEESSADRLAKSIDYTSLQAEAERIAPGFDVGSMVLSLVRGEWSGADGAARALGDTAREGLRSLAGALAAILIPVALYALLAAAVSDQVRDAAGKICAITVAVQIAGLYAACTGEVSETAGRVASLAESVAPVLATLVSASGGVVTATLLTPAAALLAQLSTSVILRGTLPLIGCAAVLAACPAFSERFSFTKLRGLLLGVCNWAHGILITAYLGLLTVRGLVGASADSVSMHTARYTVDNLLPVVGGEIADTLDLLVASARLVRGGVGVTGLILLAYVCAGPFVGIVAKMALLRLTSALVQPFGAKAADELFAGFSEVFRSLCVALASATTLFLLLIGAAAAVSGGIF